MQTQLIIDNKPTDATNGATFERVHPLTGEIVTTSAAATKEDSIKAVESAAEAFTTWSKTGPSERRMILLTAADILEQRSDEFVKAMMEEVGAAAGWAHFNIFLTTQCLREAASLASHITGETIPTDRPGVFSMTVRQAAGVVFSMAPWNAPGVLGMRSIAYPLVCGNTVVFRASEGSPRSHQILAEVLHEAGLPAGALNFISNAPHDAAEISEAIIAHPAVRRVNFTGSTAVGRKIAEACGRHLKKPLLELGGKAPLVILDDADVDGAVNAAVFGAFMYQGQICMSTERIIIDNAVADEFIEKFTARVNELTAGDPRTDKKAAIGPMYRPDSGARINAMIDDALAKGAVVANGGKADGAAMAATVVDHVKPGMTIYTDETFGPITTIIRVNGVDEAIATANDSEYGLAAAVHGTDSTRTLDAALRIEAGHVHVNGATVQNDANAPFGGVKSSGYGHFDGRAVINEFTELKWVTIEPSDQKYPM
ncbi:Vanillin dehydrogenase (plasmid) [Corynebacterium occultum]|uniref:Vanillin dehydrogenase n=1 Tax=Corynebacterium occultum TaxID=2675219 RepID=A0A6B8WBW1_9CORY|nr:aldehyde dehydrogenase [Corynebacterium occultum]QGU08795.1 Vanillin dehydrogenase [Corynebacterium occultum]